VTNSDIFWKRYSILYRISIFQNAFRPLVIDSQQLPASAARGAARRAARALPAARWLRRSLNQRRQPPAFATARQMASAWLSANLFFTRESRVHQGSGGGFDASKKEPGAHTLPTCSPVSFSPPDPIDAKGGISLMLCQERDGGCSYCTPSPLSRII